MIRAKGRAVKGAVKKEGKIAGRADSGRKAGTGKSTGPRGAKSAVSGRTDVHGAVAAKAAKERDDGKIRGKKNDREQNHRKAGREKRKR